MAVKLSYEFDPTPALVSGAGAARLGSYLFPMLDAIHTHGSIGRGAVALGLSYRHVWGVLKEHERAFGEPLLVAERGQAARLSEFGERLLWAERRVQARLSPAAEALAARLDLELLLATRPALRPVSLCASHDLLLGVLRDGVRQRGDALLDVDFVGSAVALERLNDGTTMLAGVHLPIENEGLCQRGGLVHQAIGRLLRLGDHKMIRLARREQGLMVPKNNPLGLARVADLASDRVAFINRKAGSGTRVIFDELLRVAEISAEAVPGYAIEEWNHLSVAASVAAGLGNCGFGLRAAAAHFGLDFVPVLTEHYFIVCHKPLLEEPEVEALLAELRSPEFRTRAETLAGYSAQGAGEIISLRRTLPWYK